MAGGHAAHGLARRQHGGADIDVEQGIQRFGSLFINAHLRAGNACIVDQPRKRPECSRAFEQGMDFFGLRDIGPDRQRAAATGRDGAGQFFRRGGVGGVIDGDGMAFTCQQAAYGMPDAPAAARHDHDAG